MDLSSGSPVLRSSGTTGPNVFTVAEYNFSLFFGLAIREYEATLVADQTPFDRFMEGDNGSLSPAAVRGLQTFLGKASCVRCHGGPELSNAGVTNIQRRGLLVEPGVGTHDLLERMVMGDGGVAVYDAGHYDIGVRPIARGPGDRGDHRTRQPAALELPEAPGLPARPGEGGGDGPGRQRHLRHPAHPGAARGGRGAPPAGRRGPRQSPRT